ncbi:hypothetical protein ACIOHS_27365 [Streptomyces sp. NPDC088253]|uniref:hypothetical protein n=1 Tax=Streptomyces sp. NPDC088253 TaxID=3365846 RepID=UPI003826976E
MLSLAGQELPLSKLPPLSQLGALWWLLVSQCDAAGLWPPYEGLVSMYGVESKLDGRLVDAGAAVVDEALVWVGFLRSRSRMLMPAAFLSIRPVSPDLS